MMDWLVLIYRPMIKPHGKLLKQIFNTVQFTVLGISLLSTCSLPFISALPIISYERWAKSIFTFCRSLWVSFTWKLVRWMMSERYALIGRMNTFLTPRKIVKLHYCTPFYCWDQLCRSYNKPVQFLPRLINHFYFPMPKQCSKINLVS